MNQFPVADAVYLDASCYVVPERAGEKPYTLLMKLCLAANGVK